MAKPREKLFDVKPRVSTSKGGADFSSPGADFSSRSPSKATASMSCLCTTTSAYRRIGDVKCVYSVSANP